MKLPSAYNTSGEGIFTLHPLVRLSFSLFFVIVAGAVRSGVALAVLTLILLLAGAVYKIYPLAMLRVLRPFLFLLAFTFLVQLFLTANGQWAKPNIATLSHATYYTARMALMVGFSAFFAMITSPVDIVRVFNLLFKPLSLFKISPTEMALSMLIALRFIPLLFSEGEKIIDSQRLKGILPLKGEPKARIKIIKASASLIVPLFVRTFHYASQIAVTLQYRRHDGAFFKLPKFKVRDSIAVALIIFSCVGVYAIP